VAIVKKVGVIGLGRMGEAVAYRLVKAGFEVVGYDPNPALKTQIEQEGIRFGASLEAVACDVDVIWLMVPAGVVVDNVLTTIKAHAQPGTIIIDGGNSHFPDSQRRAKELAALGFSFIDCGTSGGVHGRELGFSLMVGGDKKTYDKLEPMLCALAAPDGYAYMGSSGAGHYVKMVHNGIEYALMQAYAEGFELLKEGSFKSEELDLAAITGVWNNGSIIRSWLVELSHQIFVEDQKLSHISGRVQESGTGSWTVQEAHKAHVPVPLIEKALSIRKESRDNGGTYATKVVALMRNKFGGHAYETKE
jgi:6-phosphogluconate dehydrogenase